MTTAIFTDEEKNMYGNQVIGHKISKKIMSPDRVIRVTYDEYIDGGGTAVAEDFMRIVKDKIGVVDNAYEFAAGPGYIGFALLSFGLCKHLTLSDINPEAVAACRKTVEMNNLQDEVNVYESDCLDDIPKSEQFDLVVGNPPHFCTMPNGTKIPPLWDIRTYDPGWNVHRKFYDDIILHLKPGGHILFCENILQSAPRDFIPMIREVGLDLEEVFTVTPNPDFYYMWSRKLYYS